MKKSIAILLAVLLALALSGCGGDGAAENPSEQIASLTGKDRRTAAPTPRATPPSELVPEIPPELVEPLNEIAEPASSQEPAYEPDGTAEMTVIDNDVCAVRITGASPEGVSGFGVDVTFENKSADKTYVFSCTEGTFNGLEWAPMFTNAVPAGQTVNDRIRFDDALGEIIGSYTDIELTMRVYDSDNWLSEDVANETFRIYPNGKSAAAVYEREMEAEDTFIADDEQLSILVTAYDPGGFWGYTIRLYLVNRTDHELMFSADDVKVNGVPCDPYWARMLGPHRSAYAEISWFRSAFEENGIFEVSEIELTFRVFDCTERNAEDLYHDTIFLNP